MTIKSMTGFGRGESEAVGRLWTAEIRCVNNRFLDTKIKLPKGYAGLEERVRKMISNQHQRGRVDVVVNVQGDFSDLQTVSVNVSLAKSYRKALAEIAAAMDMEESISLSQLAAYPDVIVREQREEESDEAWPLLQLALENALHECDTMRQIEGQALVGDLRQRLGIFVENVEKIEEQIPQILVKRQENLKDRLDKILENIEIDPLRLSQEVAILADKTDVTEELVRLKSHIRQFNNFLQNGGEVGRKLDFLIQEFLREVNTIGSKISDAAIAHIIVDLKGELEKMREQIQNLE